MNRQELIRRIAAKATLHGEFLLRSGAISNLYFDKYQFEGDPELLREITGAMTGLVPPGMPVTGSIEVKVKYCWVKVSSPDRRTLVFEYTGM